MTGSAHSKKNTVITDIDSINTSKNNINNTETQIDANTALTRLMDGNKRYLAGKSTCGWTHTPTDVERRKQLANVQKPFAVILGCSDSRVPPEIIFDQRLGDLFVVRVAGNVLDDIVLGSIEYAVQFLAAPTPLVLVLGHERCGAVTAAVKETESGQPFDNHISSIINKLLPVISETKKIPGQNFVDFVDNVITNNVKTTVSQLRNSTPLLIDAVANNRVKIVGGRYDLDTGEVKIIEKG